MTKGVSVLNSFTARKGVIYKNGKPSVSTGIHVVDTIEFQGGALGNILCSYPTVGIGGTFHLTCSAMAFLEKNPVK